MVKNIPNLNNKIETQLSLKTLREVIHYCIKYGCDKNGQITQTKLAKLIYLSDFVYFYENATSITNLPYKKLLQGPTVFGYFATIDTLNKEQLIIIEEKSMGTIISNNKNKFPIKIINNDMIKVIQKIAKKWQFSNDEEIAEFIDQQLPCRLCKENENIPFTLIIQEDPNNVY